MRSDKQLAVDFRLQGKTYNEISETLGVAKSTLSSWLRNVKLSKKIESDLLNKKQQSWRKTITKFNKKRAIKIKQKTINEQKNSAREIHALNKNELKLVGIALYWAEGYKKGRWSIVFCNSDAKMIQLMMRFFREICSVQDQKFKANVQIYEHSNKEKIEKFWSKVSGIPLKQFNKPIISKQSKNKNKRPINTLPYGTLRISVSDVSTVNKIMGWIKGMSEL